MNKEGKTLEGVNGIQPKMIRKQKKDVTKGEWMNDKKKNGA